MDITDSYDEGEPGLKTWVCDTILHYNIVFQYKYTILYVRELLSQI